MASKMLFIDKQIELLKLYICFGLHCELET